MTSRLVFLLGVGLTLSFGFITGFLYALASRDGIDLDAKDSEHRGKGLGL